MALLRFSARSKSLTSVLMCDSLKCKYVNLCVCVRIWWSVDDGLVHGGYARMCVREALTA